MREVRELAGAAPYGRTAVVVAIFVVLVAAVASVGSRFGPGPWYEQLSKPQWTPPDVVFPIAWSILYLMIAIAGAQLWLVARRSPAMALWFVQLTLNGAWSWLFFGRQDIGWAVVDIVALAAAIAATIVTAWPRARLAAILLVPYLAWIGFAAALNIAIWQMN
ncbi:MAG TPA: tryptophan-rich sensory protein [Lacipirellulaceae bacterium]|nr:tryptophan-rich sensory protein [Lacipirellulaceae bacterium]